MTLLLTSLGSTLTSPLLSPLSVRADDAASTDTTSSDDEELPSIEATTFPVTVERRSLSGHVYLLSTSGDIPDVGRLILVKKDSTPIMAFRVLKRYQDKKQFAAKWLRRYNDVKQLEAAQDYTAIEKVSDRSPESPLTNQDKKDISELEKPAAPPAPEVPPPEASPLVSPQAEIPPVVAPQAEASPAPSPAEKEAAIADNTIPPLPEAAPSSPPENLPPPEAPVPAPTEAAAPPAPVPSPDGFDSELDAGTSPPPKGTAEAVAEAKEPEADDLSSVMVEEKKVTPPNNNFLSVGVGIYLNYNNNGTTSTPFYTPGGFLEYSHILKEQVFLRGGKGPADDLAIEGSLGYYKILTLVNSGDSYTVIPLKGDLRYTVMFSDEFGLFAYGGVEQNVVAATVDPTTSAQQGLNSLVPAVGLGLIFRAGPSWYVRVDGGYDGAAVSLALRF